MYLMTCSFWLTRLRNVREKYLLCFFVAPSLPTPPTPLPFPSRNLQPPACWPAWSLYTLFHADERIISSATFFPSSSPISIAAASWRHWGNASVSQTRN